MLEGYELDGYQHWIWGCHVSKQGASKGIGQGPRAQEGSTASTQASRHPSRQNTSRYVPSFYTRYDSTRPYEWLDISDGVLGWGFLAGWTVASLDDGNMGELTFDLYSLQRWAHTNTLANSTKRSSRMSSVSSSAWGTFQGFRRLAWWDIHTGI